MVKLSFKITTEVSLEKTWAFFSDFQNIDQWDPNVKSAKVTKKTPQILGSVYDLVTVFNGSESDIQYKVVGYQEHKKIKLNGKNGMVEADDEIIFRQNGTGTQIQYKADIKLRHVLCIFTPCIKGGLDQLVIDSKEGMLKKCQQLAKQ